MDLAEPETSGMLAVQESLTLDPKDPSDSEFSEDASKGSEPVPLYPSDKAVMARVAGGGSKHGQAVSKQRLANWVVQTIKLAYSRRGIPSPTGVVAHFIRGMAADMAEDICGAAGCMSSLMFARFNPFNVA